MSWPENSRWSKGDNAMAKTTWGRKETIIWPRHIPIYTYSAVFAAVVLTGVFLCARLHFGNTPLQRYYMPVYERASAIGAFSATHRSTYRMLFVGGRGAASRPAMDSDVVLGKTPERDGEIIPLALSEDARQHGYDMLFRGPQRSYVDARLSVYLKDVVYGGSSLPTDTLDVDPVNDTSSRAEKQCLRKSPKVNRRDNK
jgi:hypothetical protein